MKKNSTKRRIYLRTFSALLAVYLVLMAGFTILLLTQEKKARGLELKSFAYSVNNTVESILRENFDRQNRIADPEQVKKEFIDNSNLFSPPGTAVAVYTGDCDLLFHVDPGWWRCGFSENTEYGESGADANGSGELRYRSAFLSPGDWFDEETARELEQYYYAQPKAEKPGDLFSYSIDIEGFWLDGEMMIPDKIYVTPMYAKIFDANGTVLSGGGSRPLAPTAVSGFENTRGLPYFKDAGVDPPLEGFREKQRRLALHDMATDGERLQKKITQRPTEISYERTGPLTYYYYLTMPYQNTVHMADDQTYSSESWTVIAREVNLLDQTAATLAFVWVSSLITFLAAALILSSQTYKTYRQREELEQYRKDMTNALAHDLKTPLSIISGYAQNLMEQVRTEKRDYYAANIQENVTRMDQILREMLELSRLGDSRLQVKSEDVPLHEICAGLILRYRPVCEEKSISAHLKGEATVKADSALMERVIDNFFSNALEHTPVGGEIRIKIRGALLEFYNSGSRIPEGKEEEIWQPYKKADQSRGNTKGTGLGLSIAGAILELHHFSYGVKNREDGVIFWIQWKD